MKTILKFLILSLVLACITISCSGAHGKNTSTGYDLTHNTAVSPQNESEKIILSKIAATPAGVLTQAGNASFIITSNYFAASGRACKSIEITDTANAPASPRTVCEFEGQWGFAPEVLPTTNIQ